MPEIKGKLRVFPVKGTLQANGKPLAEAKLLFHPVQGYPKDASQFLPRAKTKEDGSFVVSTYSDNDGAPEGDYWVTVSWRGNEPNLRNDDEAELVPKEYRGRESRLKCKVAQGENTLPPFEIELPQPEPQQEASSATE